MNIGNTPRNNERRKQQVDRHQQLLDIEVTGGKGTCLPAKEATESRKEGGSTTVADAAAAVCVGGNTQQSSELDINVESSVGMHGRREAQRALACALVHTFVAHQVGASLQAANSSSSNETLPSLITPEVTSNLYGHVLEKVAFLRPYQGPAGLGEVTYIEQCRFITLVVMTLSNWGESALRT